MGFLNTAEQWIEKRADPDGFRLKVTNDAQMELIRAYGEDRSGIWIDAYARRFRALIEDPALNLEERLADKKTHTEAIEEIKKKLYH